MAVIVPLGGVHRSAKSLLAEIMNNGELEKVLVYTILKDGSVGFGTFGLTLDQMSLLSVDLLKQVMEGLEDNG